MEIKKSIPLEKMAAMLVYKPLVGVFSFDYYNAVLEAGFCKEGVHASKSSKNWHYNCRGGL
jgi:hypothetical protein